LTQKFYATNNNSLFWFSSNKDIKKATKWLTALETSKRYGIALDKVKIDKIRTLLSNNNRIDIAIKEKADQQLTELVLSFMKELQEGNIHFDYDEVLTPSDSVYIYQLLESKNEKSVSKIISGLDCKDQDYMAYKNFLNYFPQEVDSQKQKSVIIAMNYRRYLSKNQRSEQIIVNIPEAVARYYLNDSVSIEMLAVVGKKSSPTPTIASYLTSIVTFPSWNVPHSIAVKELLPKAQKNENYLEQNNFEVVDAKGVLIEDSELNWKNYNEKNFPYYFKQSTGSDNALGVLKFNFQNPFSIFLHSTSWQGVFKKENRFLSHGCIRLEKPIDLTDALLRGKLDLEELKSGKKDTESNKIELAIKIPVFIIYSPAIIVNDMVTFLPDAYSLVK